jgi:TatD DNase family protein
MLTDSHCHLDRVSLDDFEGGLIDVISAAKNDGVSQFLCVAIDCNNTPAVVDIAQQYDSVYASAGVHPMHAHETVATDAWLREWGAKPKVVALGETGLDYYYSQEYKKIQQDSFALHLTVAGELSKPVIVHTRDARKDTIDIIAEHGDRDASGVMHCFTENWEMAKQALDLNFYISISGIVTFKNAEELRDVVKKIPLDRLLIETDSPYLAPIPYRGKSNRPQWVTEVCRVCAEIKGLSYEELAVATTNNFNDLFLSQGRLV